MRIALLILFGLDEFRSRLFAGGERLFNELDLTRAPGLLDPGLERAIHAQTDEPAFSGDGFEPAALLALGRFRAEIDVVPGLERAGALERAPAPNGPTLP
jgi:hypothetical protein